MHCPFSVASQPLNPGEVTCVATPRDVAARALTCRSGCGSRAKTCQSRSRSLGYKVVLHDAEGVKP